MIKPFAIRPFSGVPVITQTFGNDYDREPTGYKFADGSIGYTPGPGGMIGTWHNGVDYALPNGTPLLAAFDGIIQFSGRDNTGFGYVVKVSNGFYVSLVAHCSELLVDAGKRVHLGDLIARSGGGTGDPIRDGNSTGSHLHWSVIRLSDSRYVSPSLLLAPKGSFTHDGIHYLPFSVDCVPSVMAYDGPSTHLHTTGHVGGTGIPCDAWMRGQPVRDNRTTLYDSRWYHLSDRPGWVCSAAVTGDAPHSTAAGGQ